MIDESMISPGSSTGIPGGYGITDSAHTRFVADRNATRLVGAKCASRRFIATVGKPGHGGEIDTTIGRRPDEGPAAADRLRSACTRCSIWGSESAKVIVHTSSGSVANSTSTLKC